MDVLIEAPRFMTSVCCVDQIPPQRILVVYDDLDIPTAAVRLRAKGGTGGHNGMRSIAQVCCSFAMRVRRASVHINKHHRCVLPSSLRRST